MSWRARPISNLAKYRNGYPFKPEDVSDIGLPIVRIRQLLDEREPFDRFEGNVPDVNRITDGDLIFSWSATLDCRSWTRGPAVLNQHLFRVDPLAGVDKRWLRWALTWSIDAFRPFMHGSAMTHITRSMMKAVRVPCPPSEAQVRVAGFLDRECDRIAAALNALERSRASVAGVRSELVGGMLDRVQPVVLKRVGVRVTQGWSPQAEDREPIGDEAAVLKLSAISGGYFDPRQMKALPHANASEVDRYRVRGGDLLMVRASGSLSQLGRACLVMDEPRRPLLFPDIVYRLTCDEAQVPPWVLGEILATPQGRDAVEMLKRGAANNKVRIEDVRNLAVPLPTPELLGRIMRLMTGMVPAERSVARSSGRLSEALTAYRSSLIHEAVTGKLDVTSLSDRQMDERLHAAAENRLDEVAV